MTREGRGVLVEGAELLHERLVEKNVSNLLSLLFQDPGVGKGFLAVPLQFHHVRAASRLGPKVARAVRAIWEAAAAAAKKIFRIEVFLCCAPESTKSWRGCDGRHG